MTAKRARKSPKVETICAYQRRRMVTTRSTARMLRGSGALGAGTGMASTVLASSSLSSWLRDSWLMGLVPSTDATGVATDAEILVWRAGGHRPPLICVGPLALGVDSALTPGASPQAVMVGPLALFGCR